MLSSTFKHLSRKYLFFGKLIKSLNLNIKTMEFTLFFCYNDIIILIETAKISALKR